MPGQLSSGTALQIRQHRPNIPPAAEPGEVPLVFQAGGEARKVCDWVRGETIPPLFSSSITGLVPQKCQFLIKQGNYVNMMAFEATIKERTCDSKSKVIHQICEPYTSDTGGS